VGGGNVGGKGGPNNDLFETANSENCQRFALHGPGPPQRPSRIGRCQKMGVRPENGQARGINAVACAQGQFLQF